jgi:hypothetical protein
MPKGDIQEAPEISDLDWKQAYILFRILNFIYNFFEDKKLRLCCSQWRYSRDDQRRSRPSGVAGMNCVKFIYPQRKE